MTAEEHATVTPTATTTTAARKIDLNGLSIDEFFASFAYKKMNFDETTTTTPLSTTSLKSPTDKPRSLLSTTTQKPPTPSAARAAAEGPDTPPPVPPFVINKQRIRKRTAATSAASSSTSTYFSSLPSSFIRTTIRGKPVIVSGYFPLPPDADSPPVLVKRKRINYSTPKNPLKKKERKKDNDALLVDKIHDLEEGKQQEERVEEDKKKKKKKKRALAPHFSAAEKKLDAYKRIDFNNTWKPPASCYRLLQERHSFDPWRVLIICMLLNVTTGKQVAKVLPGLFLLCCDAETTLKVPAEEIEKVIQPLGLQKKRAKMIKKFTEEYLGDDWTHVTQLHGIGKYAADAYAIFCVGMPEAVTPQDHKLIDYWNFVRGFDDTQQEDSSF